MGCGILFPRDCVYKPNTRSPIKYKRRERYKAEHNDLEDADFLDLNGYYSDEENDDVDSGSEDDLWYMRPALKHSPKVQVCHPSN